MAAARQLGIPDLELRSLPFESVRTYEHSERVPAGFPRPDEHFVVADYLIDLPVVAVDLSSASEHYGRVLSYSYGEYWVIADSFAEFVAHLQDMQEAALYGARDA